MHLLVELVAEAQTSPGAEPVETTGQWIMHAAVLGRPQGSKLKPCQIRQVE